MPNRIRILIVDDSPRARASLRSLLDIYSEAIEIEEVENGLKALARIDECAPDVVFLDMMMPVLNGLQVTQVIKTHTPFVKVIGLSISPEYRDQALAAGADAFVSKGDSPTALLRTLSRITGLSVENGNHFTEA